MPYEMVITNCNTLAENVIGFGEQQAVAERVFNWTWRGLVSDGYISLHNAKTPLFVEIAPKQGATVMTLELRYRPQWDLANVLRLIQLLAMDKTFPKYFASGTMMANTIRAEQAWKEANYVAQVVEPSGLMLRCPLAADRSEAIIAFTRMVRERELKGQLVSRSADAVMKYTALDSSGATTFEFVEVMK